MILKANSPAKINLFLHIVGKRNDGYHLIESLFTPVNELFDEVEVWQSEQLITEYENGVISGDIILKTATLIQSKFNIQNGAHFKIKKNIPISAGLGGGSSNAATAIKLLNELWELNLDKYQMINIGRQIGADVPFFIENKLAFVEGIGEKITPINLDKSYYLLLINPNIECSTKQIFDLGFDKFDKNIMYKEIADIKKHHNSLAKNACSTHFEIKEVLDFLNNQNGIYFSRMSGSGATCFALFENDESLHNTKNSIPKSWWSFSQQLIL